MIVVLALKSDRVGQAFTLRPFRTLFFYFTPGFVLRTPGDLAVGVGQFLWRAQVVALVPRQYVNRQRLRGVGPQRVLVDVVGAGVTRLGQQAHRLVAQGLGHGDEGAGFVEVVDGFGTGAVSLCRAAFPGEGVAVQAEQCETAPQFALFAGLFVLVPLQARFASVWVVGVGVFVEASSQRVVGVVDAQSVVFKAYQAVEQVPLQLALLAVVPTVISIHID